MIYHSGIFYPDDREELERLVMPVERGDEHKAFILPHMQLAPIAGLYRKVFSSIPDGKRVIALIPLHREMLAADEGKLWLPAAARTEETPLGPVRIGSVCCGDGSPYEEEEYGAELLYPYAAAYLPHSEICPVFTCIRSAEESKKLSAFLRSLDDGHTAFIVSSNMTGKLPAESVAAARDAMIEHLESGDHLLDLWRKGHISACGAPVIESLSRLSDGRWHLAGISEKETGAGHAALWMD